jgi:hypothetical protein
MLTDTERLVATSAQQSTLHHGPVGYYRLLPLQPRRNPSAPGMNNLNYSNSLKNYNDYHLSMRFTLQLSYTGYRLLQAQLSIYSKFSHVVFMINARVVRGAPDWGPRQPIWPMGPADGKAGVPTGSKDAENHEEEFRKLR